MFQHQLRYLIGSLGKRHMPDSLDQVQFWCTLPPALQHPGAYNRNHNLRFATNDLHVNLVSVNSTEFCLHVVRFEIPDCLENRPAVPFELLGLLELRIQGLDFRTVFGSVGKVLGQIAIDKPVSDPAPDLIA